MPPLSWGRIAEEVRQVGEAPTFCSGAILWRCFPAVVPGGMRCRGYNGKRALGHSRLQREEETPFKPRHDPFGGRLDFPISRVLS